MSLISISEASELTGKSIPTIYRHVKDGKLTKIDNKIDTAELLRVYGAFRGSTDYHRENELLHRLNTDLKQDKEKLYQINELLRRSIDDLKQSKEKLYQIIEYQQKCLSQETVRVKPRREKQVKQIEQIEQIEQINKMKNESLTQRFFRKLFFK